jgi:hypothetical protein
MNLPILNSEQIVIVDDNLFSTLNKQVWTLTSGGAVRMHNRNHDGNRRYLFAVVGELANVPRQDDELFGPLNGDWCDARTENIKGMSRDALPPHLPAEQLPARPARDDTPPVRYPRAIGRISTADVVRLHRKLRGQT